MYHCGHCGNYHTGTCPTVKSVEYYPDGTIKKIEYIREHLRPLADPQYNFTIFPTYFRGGVNN